jgi:YcxB-like protein
MTGTFTYTYSYADCLATLRAREIGRRLWLRRAGRYTLFNAAFLGVAAALAISEGDGLADLAEPDAALTIAAFMVGLTAFLVAVDVVFERWMPWFGFRRLSVRNQPVRLHFGEALAWSMSGMSGEASWSSVKRLVRTQQGLFLFISEVEAFMLPRRALADDAALDALAAFARARMAEASASGPPAPPRTTPAEKP